MNWDQLGEYERAKRVFGIANSMVENAKGEQGTKPDLTIMPAFEAAKGVRGLGKYWLDPFIVRVR